MAGVGEAASIVGLCGAAFQVSKAVYDLIDSFKSQRQKVREIQGELGTLTVVLKGIRQKVQDSPPNEQKRFEILREPLKCCTAICEEMRIMLVQCTTHTKDSGDSVRDWLKMQYRGGSFDNMKQRLAAYKSTLSITFDSISFQDQGATQESLSALKVSIQGTKEDLKDQLSDIRDSIDDASASLQQQLRADQTQIQDCLDRLTQAQSIANTIRPQIDTSRNTAGQNARAIFGTDNIKPTFDLDASQNTAHAGSTMQSGVHTPETLQALLKGNSAADYMAILQAAQTHPADVTTELLQVAIANRVQSRTTPVTSGEPTRAQGQNMIESGEGQKLEDLLDNQATGGRVLEQQR